MKSNGYYEKDVAKKVASVLNEIHALGTYSAPFDTAECMRFIKTICPVFQDMPQEQAVRLMACLSSAHKTGLDVSR